MTQEEIRDYEINLMKECIEDAEMAIGKESPAAVAGIAVAFFKLRRGRGNKL